MPLALDPNLIAAVAQARDWFARLKDGQARSVRDLAAAHAVDRGDVSRLLPLALLAPDIVEAILEGRQPVDLTVSCLKRTGDLPPSWVRDRIRGALDMGGQNPDWTEFSVITGSGIAQQPFTFPGKMAAKKALNT